MNTQVENMIARDAANIDCPCASGGESGSRVLHFQEYVLAGHEAAVVEAQRAREELPLGWRQ